MKTLLLSALAILAGTVAQANDGLLPSAFLRTFSLDERTPYQISVAVERGMTTLVFPEPPQNYSASHIAFVEPGQKIPDYSADVRIDFVALTHRGSESCSIRAVRPDAQDTLSVFLNGKVYQLFLHADGDKPLLTVEFSFRPHFAAASAQGVSPNRLLDCLTRAKAYPVLSKYYPDQLDDLTRAVSLRVITYPDFRVEIVEVFRFEAEDTLVFHLLLQNQTAHQIAYKPSELSVRVEPQTDHLRQAPPIYDASVVDASGVMPGHSVTTAWFAITGTRDGGRNNLDPARNLFTVLVPRAVFPSVAGETVSAHAVDPKETR